VVTGRIGRVQRVVSLLKEFEKAALKGLFKIEALLLWVSSGFALFSHARIG
jgi:hypothetical protein